MQVYLDNAASTPLDTKVISAMQKFMQTYYGNPSSAHKKGREARVKIEKARKKVASIIGSKEQEIIFTSGGTEANNGILKSLALSGKIKKIISSPIEHHSILDSLYWIKKNTKTEVSFLSVNKKGDIDLNELENLLQKHPFALVSLMHGNNEIGNILDIETVGSLCHKYNALFHTDMVQTLGHLPINLNKLPVDFASASAHKIHGPKGMGFIYAHLNSTKLHTFLHGGAQEKSIRAGTENGAGIIGLSKAYELASKKIIDNKKHALELKKYTIQQISKLAPSITFNGRSNELDKSLPYIINIRLSDNYDETLLFNFDMQGLYVSGGSACASGAYKESHVIHVLSKEEISSNSIRISFSQLTTFKEIDFAVKIIASVVNHN